MADKTNLNYEVRELKLGASFTSNKASQYHTIKYDFKPASVDVNKMATVDVGTNNQVTVTVPHLDGAGVPQTVFKGNQRPYTKECVLIIDRSTGEITLEKLSSNIQVKKTRQETSQKPLPPSALPSEFTNTTQRSTSRTRVTTNRRANHSNPAPATSAPQSSSQQRPGAPPAGKPPQSMVRSPQRTKTSPPQAAPWSGGGNSTLASLPMIGLDDALGMGGPPAPAPAPPPPSHNGYGGAPTRQPERHSYAPERRDNHVERNERPERNERQERNERLERLERIERQERPSNPVVPPPNHVPPQASNNPTQADDSSSSSSSDSDSGSDSGSDSDDDSGAHPAIPNGNDARRLVDELGRRLVDRTGDPRSRSYLVQRIAIAIQRGNAASVMGTFAPGTAPNPALPSDVLNDDLCLSESGSDSD